MNSGLALDLASDGPLPWPRDAIMIVASRAGTENRAAMEGVVTVECRLCGVSCRADTRTIRTANNLPERAGRPVKFFCVECAVKHKRSEVGLLIDQRDGRNEFLKGGQR